MNIVKGIQKLYLSAEQAQKLETGARLHKRLSNIEFKILTIDATSVVIQVKQGKQLSQNYANKKTLIERTKQLFAHFITGKQINVHATEYVESPVSKIDPEWINIQMNKQHIRIKDIVIDTGLDKTNVSAWVNNKRPLSRPAKAMFYYYFMNKHSSAEYKSAD